MGKAKFQLDMRPGSLASVALCLGIGALGVVMAHHPMLFSGFRRIQTDLGDTRLVHYLLEHGYRWVRREPGHQEFWSPPFFYPVANAAAYSDVLLSVGPAYWLWRVMGASPDRSFGLWMVSTSALNYAAGLLLFRRGLGFGVLASAAAAALVAFGAPRVNQLPHPQLLPCFYVMLTVYALSRLAGDRPLSRGVRAGYWLLAMVAGAAQLYSGVYLGWFLITGLGLTAIAALVWRPSRGVLLEMVSHDVWPIVGAGAIGVLLLLPFLSHYRQAAPDVNARQYLPMLRVLHPQTWSWLNMGEKSWLWGWTASRGPFRSLPAGPEHQLGIGWVTPFACALGLYLSRQRPICRLAALVSLITWIGTTYLPGDELAILAAGISYYCLAGLFHEVEHPGSQGIVVTVVLGLLLVIRSPNPFIEVLGLTAIILCLLEIGRLRRRPLAWIVPGLALGALSLMFFPLQVILIGVMLVAPVAGLLVYFHRSRGWEIGLGSLALLMLFLMVVTFLDRPRVLIGGLAAAPISLAVTAPRRLRPPAWLLLRAMLIALPFLVLFYNRDSLWLGYSRLIPGAVGIRAVGRVVLILLIPAALGLACLVEFLGRRRSTIVAGIVVLVCLAEQGVTTETFDAAVNRATITGIARQIDRRPLAFYYHPSEGQPPVHYQLDAMWASLASGVPTINGYSGYAPRVWEGFYAVDRDAERTVEDVLAEWVQKQGLPPDRVQWVKR